MDEWVEIGAAVFVAGCVLYATYRLLSFAFSYLVAFALLKVVMPWLVPRLPKLLDDYERLKSMPVGAFARLIRP